MQIKTFFNNHQKKMFLICFLLTQFLLKTTTAEYVWNGSEWVWKQKEVNKIYLVCFAVSIFENPEQRFSRFPFPQKPRSFTKDKQLVCHIVSFHECTITYITSSDHTTWRLKSLFSRPFGRLFIFTNRIFPYDT